MPKNKLAMTIGPPLVPQMPKTREYKAAKRQFLANGRHDGDHQQHLPHAAWLVEQALQPLHRAFQVRAERIELLHDDIQPAGRGIKRQRQHHGRRQRGRGRPAQEQRLPRAARQHDGHQQRRRGHHDQLRHQGQACQIAKRLRLRQGEAHEKAHQQDQHAAKYGSGHAGRIFAIVEQLPEPQAEVQPFTLAKQHDFRIELIHGPANGQQAAGESCQDNGRPVNNRLRIVAL